MGAKQSCDRAHGALLQGAPTGRSYCDSLTMYATAS